MAEKAEDFYKLLVVEEVSRFLRLFLKYAYVQLRTQQLFTLRFCVYVMRTRRKTENHFTFQKTDLPSLHNQRIQCTSNDIHVHKVPGLL